jgi:hypothetical protein
MTGVLKRFCTTVRELNDHELRATIAKATPRISQPLVDTDEMTLLDIAEGIVAELERRKRILEREELASELRDVEELPF